MLEIELIPLLKDNYAFCLRDADTGKVGVVDPGDAAGVMNFLSKQSRKLDFILNTHHHWDHTNGNLGLKALTGCTIVGSAMEAEKIPGIQTRLHHDDTFWLGKSQAKIIHTPGHTQGQIAFWFANDRALFTGDTLFSLGCGRLFEGTAKEMWSSLLALRSLPANTRIFCGHEYTEQNAKFASTIDSNNESLKKKYAEIRDKRKRGEPTVPSLLGEEVLCNPFLRADDLDFSARLGLPNAPADQVFAHIRLLKDRFS